MGGKQTLKIWQTDSLYKVLQKKAYSGNIPDKLLLKLYQNEREGVRIYCTPNRAVENLDVEISEIKSIDGKPSGLTVSVGFVLYVPLTRSSVGTKSEIGEYPDAILPIEVAKKYHKNRVGANENQELWITVQTQAETPAGEYRATVTIAADGERYSLPLQITVWDYALPSKNHTKQLFIIDSKHLELVEGGGLAKYKRYYDDMMEYRINGSRMPFSLENDYVKVTADFIEQLKIYHLDERVSVIQLPVFYTAEYDDVHYEKTEYLFNEVVKASIEDKINYFTKTMNYLWILDEPHLTPQKIEYCKKVLPAFEKLKRKIANVCKEKARLEPLYEELANSLANIPNVITSGVLPSIFPIEPNDYYITWCPAFPAHSESVTMWQVLNKGEKWWYGCDWPVPPYATYHIDDKLLSSRLLSWMQYSYNVTGNLYWRINFWARKKDGDLVFVDPYKQSPFETTNGEGTLVYPGKEYGLDTFVPTIRLESIRDGIEDFEALYSLDKEMEKNANDRGMTALHANELLSPIYTRLFHLSMLPEELLMPFDEARERIAELLTATTAYGFFVTERNENEKRIQFVTSAQTVQIEGGKLERQGAECVVTDVKEKIAIRLLGKKGEKRLIIYLQDAEREFKCSLTDNWSVTANKYGVKTDPKGILKPFYDVLCDQGLENPATVCKDLGSLVHFVWRTEAVIQKNKGDKETEVVFYLPKGEFFTQESYRTEKLDETGRKYTITTDKNLLEVEVKNEKGKHPLTLYL